MSLSTISRFRSVFALAAAGSFATFSLGFPVGAVAQEAPASSVASISPLVQGTIASDAPASNAHNNGMVTSETTTPGTVSPELQALVPTEQSTTPETDKQAVAAVPAVLAPETIEYVNAVDSKDPNVKVEVEKNVTNGQKIRIKGSGWQTTDKKSGSTIAVKINWATADGKSGQYTRSGIDIKKHPVNNTDEPTIWELVNANEDGTFDTEIDAPPNLITGQKLQVNFASGLFKAGDSQHSVTSPALVVGGKEWVEPEKETITCTTSLAKPMIAVNPNLNADGTLTIKGEGFCNTVSGGAKVAIKIDNGKYSRLETTKKMDNLTVWELVDANPSDGTWSINMQLPDGSVNAPNGSTPAFTPGEHSIRVLSGSLQENDPQTTLNGKFVVGDYRPTGEAGLLNYKDDITDNKQGEISAAPEGDDLVVTVPSGKEGDWVFLATYGEKGSQSDRTPWGADQWFQLDKNKKVKVTTKDLGTKVPAGKVKLTVQDGNRGANSKLIGWTWWTFREAPAPDPKNTSTPTTSYKPSADSALWLPITVLQELEKTINDVNKDLAVVAPSTTAKTSTSAAAKTSTPKNTAKPKNNSNNSTEVNSASGGASGKSKASASSAKNGTPASTAGSRSTRVGSTTSSGRSGGTGSKTKSGTSGGAVAAKSGSTVKKAAGKSTTSSASAKASAKPKNTPKAPVKSRDDLNNSNVGKVTGSLNGEKLTIKVPNLKQNDWVFLYLYSDKDSSPVDWYQLKKNSETIYDTSSLEDGEYTVAVLDQKGKLQGWVDIVLGADEHALEEGEIDKASSIIGLADWGLIATGVGVPLAVIGVIALINRRKNLGLKV